MADQWDLLGPLLAPTSSWALFQYLFIPHFQGLAYVLWHWLNQVFSYDARIPNWLALAAIASGATLTLRLIQKYRPLQWSDLLLPIILLSPKFHESLVGVANPSHGPFSWLFVLLLAWSLSWQPSWRRVGWQAILFWLTIFSGFAYLLVPSWVLLLVIIFFQDWRQGHRQRCVQTAVALVCHLFAVAHFGLNYQTALVSDTTTTPAVSGWLTYMSLMQGHLLGWWSRDLVHVLVGGLFLYLQLTVWVHSFRLLWSQEQPYQRTRWQITWVLTSASLAFCAVVAWQRQAFGLDTAVASRYLSYLLPGLVGIWLALPRSHQTGSWLTDRRVWWGGVATILIVFQLRADPIWTSRMADWWWKKNQFAQCSMNAPSPSVCLAKFTTFYYADGGRLDQLYQLWQVRQGRAGRP